MLTRKQLEDVQSLPVWRPIQEDSMALTTNDPVTAPVADKRFSMLALLSRAGEAWLRTTVATLRKKTAEAGKGFRVPFVERRLLLLVTDALLTLITIWLAQQTASFDSVNALFAQNPTWVGNYWFLAPAFLLLWWVIASFTDIYDISSATDRLATGMRLGATGMIGVALYAGVRYFLPALPTTALFLYFWLTMLLVIGAWRYLYAPLSLKLVRPHRILVLGTGKRGQAMAKLLEKTTHMKYQMLGYVDDTATSEEVAAQELPVLGVAADLPTLVQQHNVHEVVVAIHGDVTNELFQRLIACQGRGVQISWMPDLYEKLCYSVPVEYIDPTWALYAVQGQPIFNRLQLIGKRCMDLAIVLLALPGFLFLIPLLALAIRLDSKGPIFYRQVRTGRGGQNFKIWKFRTMVTDAEKNGVQWASKGDKRITRIGRFLRKTRLDELPQIFNILTGEMSIVGPRPERPEFIEQLQQEIPFYHTRLMVKPGLTGWAQVCYDYGNTVEDALFKLHYDFYYIRYWSLWLDFYIIFKTISVVFKLKGM
ncbi:MAG: sugar transferase [Caldilinea sp. CFX5]|nr:sugar transferase [Caldilinea sp. CFX5]